MINTYRNASVAAFALTLAVSALASSSFAQGEHGMSTAREQALRECSTMAGKYTNGTWQTTQLHSYRSCMMQHGQPE
jgi:hypothetical protein